MNDHCWWWRNSLGFCLVLLKLFQLCCLWKTTSKQSINQKSDTKTKILKAKTTKALKLLLESLVTVSQKYKKYCCFFFFFFESVEMIWAYIFGFVGVELWTFSHRCFESSFLCQLSILFFDHLLQGWIQIFSISKWNGVSILKAKIHFKDI